LADNHKNLPEISPGEAREQLLTGLLASDLAQEIRAEFIGRIDSGWQVPRATGHVLGKFQPALSSPQDGPVVLVALAALQVREGHLQEVMQSAAIDLIESGEALAAYKPADFAQRKSVAAMLEDFKELLSEMEVDEE
jgi:hypothetical protein